MSKTIKIDNATAKNLLTDLKIAMSQPDERDEMLESIIAQVEGWAESTEEPERVIFRKFPHDGAVIALFPDQYDERTGYIGSYMQLGQHSDCMPDFGDTKAADYADYAPLYTELVRQGYTNLKVVKRFGKLGRK